MHTRCAAVPRYASSSQAAACEWVYARGSLLLVGRLNDDETTSGTSFEDFSVRSAHSIHPYSLRVPRHMFRVPRERFLDDARLFLYRLPVPDKTPARACLWPQTSTGRATRCPHGQPNSIRSPPTSVACAHSLVVLAASARRSSHEFRAETHQS